MVFWPIFDPKIGFLRFYPGKLRVITSKPLLIDSTVKNTSRKVYLEPLAYRAENARKSFYYYNPRPNPNHNPEAFHNPITTNLTLTRARNNRIRVKLACHVTKTVFFITLQGSVFTLRHGAGGDSDFGISVKKYTDLDHNTFTPYPLGLFTRIFLKCKIWASDLVGATKYRKKLFRRLLNYFCRSSCSFTCV